VIEDEDEALHATELPYDFLAVALNGVVKFLGLNLFVVIEAVGLAYRGRHAVDIFFPREGRERERSALVILEQGRYEISEYNRYLFSHSVGYFSTQLTFLTYSYKRSTPEQDS
jgi:hypothetical protein